MHALVAALIFTLSYLGCVFRRKRSPIPADGDHPDRSMAITLSGI
jgi:hypothetical protein